MLIDKIVKRRLFCWTSFVRLVRCAFILLTADVSFVFSSPLLLIMLMFLMMSLTENMSVLCLLKTVLVVICIRSSPKVHSRNSRSFEFYVYFRF